MKKSDRAEARKPDRPKVTEHPNDEEKALIAMGMEEIVGDHPQPRSQRPGRKSTG